MEIKKKQTLRVVENDTHYVGCIFFPENEVRLKGSTFENCSFRSPFKIGEVKNCSFIDCNFSGVTFFEMRNVEMRGCTSGSNLPFLTVEEQVNFYLPKEGTLVRSAQWGEKPLSEREKIWVEYRNWYASQQGIPLEKEVGGMAYHLVPSFEEVDIVFPHFYIARWPVWYTPYEEREGLRLPMRWEWENATQGPLLDREKVTQYRNVFGLLSFHEMEICTLYQPVLHSWWRGSFAQYEVGGIVQGDYYCMRSDEAIYARWVLA